jgi:hypothetical protein
LGEKIRIKYQARTIELFSKKGRVYELDGILKFNKSATLSEL